MSNTINNLIEIVYDSGKKKLRARSIQDGRWVRFPNNLRKEKAVYLASKMTQGRGESWIAGGEIKAFAITKEKNEELETILNIKNKALLKQFYEVVFDEKSKKVNTEMMNLIFLVKKIFPDVDEQLLQPMIKKYTHSAFVSSDHLLPLQNMLSVYNERRVIGLFAAYGDEEDFLEDTVIMYERLFNNDVEVNNVMPEKPKNIRELHTLFTRECGKIKTIKNKLNQNLSHLNEKVVGDCTIFIPETSYDLINIGNSLGICVGNGYYAEKVLKKQCNIVALKDNKGKFKYCIEFYRGSILQGRAYANGDMSASLKKTFIDLLKEPIAG